MGELCSEDLKRVFIIEDMAKYWSDKMKTFGDIIELWYNKGITVSVMDGKVVAIYGANELDTKQKHEVANATEGYLYAEGQFNHIIEMQNDAKEKEGE